MTKNNYALHLHEWSIYQDYYEKNKQFKNFFKILATDIHEETNKKYLTAFEAHRYPIYGLMFHPEY
jgi:anthranilate/para-aminobenzoate synthase component II